MAPKAPRKITRRRKAGARKKPQPTRGGELTLEFQRVRIGLFAGIAAITLSSAFMNISGWVSMAATFNQAATNAMLSGGMELVAICALPFAGFMMRNKHYGKAWLALAITGVALAVNIYATQNFLHLQSDTLINSIELSALELDQIEGRISDIEREIESIIESNGGTVPRDVQTIESAYGHLDADENPINMMRKDAEIGARTRYEELRTLKDTWREEAINPALTANDTARPVIPPQHMRVFVIMLEVMKATGLYILGNSTLFWSASRRKDHERKRKWAIIGSKPSHQISVSSHRPR